MRMWCHQQGRYVAQEYGDAFWLSAIVKPKLPHDTSVVGQATLHELLAESTLASST